MGDVVRLPTRGPPPVPPVGPGNGARGALIEVGLTLPDTNEIDAAIWTDWLLMELWSRGFMVVALPGDVA